MAEVESAIDAYAERILSKGLTGVRVIISKGSVNNWHGYVQVLGTADKGGARGLETGRHESFIDALMELEEIMANRLEENSK